MNFEKKMIKKRGTKTKRNKTMLPSSCTTNKRTCIEDFHKYNIKHNTKYREEYEDYIKLRKYVINRPLEEIELAFIDTFDMKKAKKQIKKQRQEDFDKHYQNPKYVYYYYGEYIL